jgi:hypothetical protein
MKKKHLRKLRLSVETLRHLDGQALTRAAGGDNSDSPTNCVSYCANTCKPSLRVCPPPVY